MLYATGSAGLATLVRGSSRRITIMRFSTREYQTDQSSLKPAPGRCWPVIEKRQKQRQQQKQPHSCAGVDRVTPYQCIFDSHAVGSAAWPVRGKRSRIS
jgi:hypothetical protein